jgi:Cytochrome c554 and c-prime
VGAPVHRELSALERAWPWLGASALGTAALTTVTWLAVEGHLDGILGERPADHVLRGYTPVGLFLGVAALVLAALAAAYSLRKRPLQEPLQAGRGAMTTWLWLHVAAGILAVAAVLLHAGHGLVSAELSTGKVLAAIFALLTLSGIGWRLAYHVVPPRAARVVGNHSERGSELHAEARALEIEKTAAGGSAELHRLTAWLLADPRAPDEITAAGAALGPAEQGTLVEIARLSESRHRALARRALQARTTRVLQAWRVAHVPLALLAVPAILAHAIFALDLHVLAVGPGDAPLQALSGFHRARECASCHRAIVEQWSGSMHAHAMRSPVTVAQNNQLLAADLGAQSSPDPRHLCVNCHGPVGVAATGRARLPLERSGYDDGLLNEGVGCSACHQWRGAEGAGIAGLATFQEGLRPGSTCFGAIDDPVGNAFHRSRAANIVKRDGALCKSCHSVQYDTNGDGKIQKGVDLVLQTTTQEYEEYAARGGRPTCAGCHMPVLAGVDRAAEHASLVTEQDTEAPLRQVHDHSFVGVDYAIDEVAARDPQRAAREALLRSAARLEIEPSAAAVKGGELTFVAAITSAGVGHNLPSGFAFARQMWLEVRVTGEGGRLLFASGVLARPSDDLCDAATLDEADNPARPFLVGCKVSDRQLVSFQQKLVDRIDVVRESDGSPRLDAQGETRAVAAAGAKETWLQHLTAGAVPRVRPSDGTVLAPIVPDETRRLVYRVPVGDTRRVGVSVRLLFRSLAPYMIRALGAGQAAGEVPLAPLVENLQVVEMAAKTMVVAGGT